MYVRQPSIPKSGIKIPENYHGHAFSNPPSYSDMPPPVRQVPLPRTSPQDFDLTEEESINSAEDIDFPADREQTVEADLPYTEEPPSRPCPTSRPAAISATERESGQKNSLFTTLLPPISNGSNRFPFGHGIGSEELLILAMMLLVYLSDANEGSADHELLLLLGLLLFAG